MLSTVDWIAVALGGICGIQALVYWQKSKRRHQQLEFAHEKAEQVRSQLQQSQIDLQQAHGKAEEARRQLQELIAHPPVPTDTQFASHLSALDTRIVDRIIDLEDARVSSVQPLQVAAKESEQSRVVERKDRFATYYDTLRKANVQISIHVERLLVSHSALLALRDALKAGHLASLVGHSDCAGIERVVEALSREEPPDAVWTKSIRNREKEFAAILKLRDKIRALDRREREAARAEADSAFNKYKLPPITPLEKFRALVPRGQRDNFGGSDNDNFGGADK
jgi:carbonic anhydrase